jgi:hypothetical protein
LVLCASSQTFGNTVTKSINCGYPKLRAGPSLAANYNDSFSVTGMKEIAQHALAAAEDEITAAEAWLGVSQSGQEIWARTRCAQTSRVNVQHNWCGIGGGAAKVNYLGLHQPVTDIEQKIKLLPGYHLKRK